MTARIGKETQAAGNGLRIGRFFGIEVVAHWSLLVIFALITVSLGGGVFPGWHPDWSWEMTWGIAFLAATLFFMSIAVHELAHGLVGKAKGIPVERITLFIFGGMAHTNKQPPSAKAELLTAAVGPAISLLIGLVATFVGSWLAVAAAPGQPVTDDPMHVIASAGPVATLLLWLGPVNIVLAVFNMIPGFPLDGGRVLRAFLWWITGNLRRATRYASAVGQLFAWFLIACGILMIFGFFIPFFGTGLGPGLWLILIGWFLHNAARLSYDQVLIGEALEDVPVQAIMRSRLQTVKPTMSIETLIGEYFMNYEQRAFPVVGDDGALQGLVCFDDVRSVPRVRWPYTMVAEVMTPLEKLETMDPQTPALEAFKRLGDRDIDQIPIIEGDHLLGMVHRKDIMKWLSLHAVS